jgi:uncharacterized damage-inducible protein DinB
MANAENPAPPAAQAVNQDDESRMLLSFLQRQRDAVLKIVERLPEDDWQKPVVPSGWTVAGMLAHIGGAEYHWFQHVTAGRVGEPQPDGEEKEEGGYDPNAAFASDYPSAEIIASYRQVCGMSDDVLAVTPLSAAPRRPDAHPNPEVVPQITNVRWIVLHVIEETATHSGHLEIARELLDGKTGLAGR